MWNRTFAIAFLAVRSAVRSRLFISLMVVLLAVIIGLPITIKGDGTVTGQVRILLYYTLGLAAVILGIATLWASCGAISEEIQEKQIRLVAVKPVRHFQVWLGKWLGMLIINAVLLCVVGVTLYGLLRWNIAPSRTTKQERGLLRQQILTGRRLILPYPESVDKEVHQRLDHLLEEGNIPADIPHNEAFSLIKKRLLAERSTVAPGRSKQWIFDIPARVRPDSAVMLRFRFASSFRDRKPVTGTWSVGPENEPDIFNFTTANIHDGVHRFSVPASVISPGSPVIVKFANAERSLSNTVVFGPDSGVELMARESMFESNLARSLIVIFCHLALLAALGLTVGTLFSFPVATFVASSVLAISMMSHYFTLASSPEHVCKHHHHGPKPEHSVFHVTGEKIIRQLEVIVAPAMRLSPLGPLSDGILVSWGFTGRAVLLLFVVYPGVLGLIGGYILKHRELALPG